MTPTQAPAVFLTTTRTKRPAAWPALALAIASAAAYAVFLVLPYYVNDLGRFPLDEVAYGRPDPMTQWPYAGGGLLSFVFGLGSLFAIACAPLTVAGSMVWAGANLWRERVEGNIGRIVTSLLAVAFGIGSIAYLASPLGWALMTRFLD